MKTDNQEFNPNEQIQVIREMIERTKRETAEDSWSYILWGWLILAGCIFFYLLVFLDKPELGWLPWAILMPAGGIITFFVEWRRNVKRDYRIKTYAERAISWLWIGCGGCMFFIGFVAVPAGIIQNWSSIAPLISLFAGLGTMVTAKIVEYKLSFYLSFLWFVAVIIMIFIHPYYYMLVMGINIIPAYLVPGYLLRRKYKRA